MKIHLVGSITTEVLGDALFTGSVYYDDEEPENPEDKFCVNSSMAELVEIDYLLEHKDIRVIYSPSEEEVEKAKDYFNALEEAS